MCYNGSRNMSRSKESSRVVSCLTPPSSLIMRKGGRIQLKKRVPGKPREPSPSTTSGSFIHWRKIRNRTPLSIGARAWCGGLCAVPFSSPCGALFLPARLNRVRAPGTITRACYGPGARTPSGFSGRFGPRSPMPSPMRTRLRSSPIGQCKTPRSP